MGTSVWTQVLSIRRRSRIDRSRWGRPLLAAPLAAKAAFTRDIGTFATVSSIDLVAPQPQHYLIVNVGRRCGPAGLGPFTNLFDPCQRSFEFRSEILLVREVCWLRQECDLHEEAVQSSKRATNQRDTARFGVPTYLHDQCRFSDSKIPKGVVPRKNERSRIKSTPCHGR